MQNIRWLQIGQIVTPSALQMWLVADPCGKQYALIVHLLLLCVDFFLCCCALWPLMGPSAWPWIFAHQISCVLTAWAHLVCMLSDPGAVPLGDGDIVIGPIGGEDGTICYCSVCQLVKPPRAHHCSTCGRCISRMDHHCMWMNNCIGASNHRHFLLFLIYLTLHCSITIVALAAGIASYWVQGMAAGIRTESGLGHRSLDGHWSVIIFLGVVLVFTFRFALSLLHEQAALLKRNQTGIEALQGVQGIPRPWPETLEEVMGTSLSWTWLAPLPMRRSHLKP